MKAKEYEKILAGLIGIIKEGVHIVDENGTTIIYSKLMSELERTRREDVIGKAFSDVYSHIPMTESTIGAALLEKKTTLNKQQTYLNRYGKEITTINSTMPIIMGGRVIAAIEIANDITEIKYMTDTILDLHVNKGVTAPKVPTIRHYNFSDIAGETPKFKKQIETAKKAAGSDAPVFIYGETGTGKELVAQSIHYEGIRGNGPFLAQNCAAIPETLLEGILFGTAKGGFTGAEDRAGLFEQASGGTLLLDEISAMPYELQSKLLRVLQEDYIRRVGGSKDIPIDVRIIATVNETPEELIEKGALRKDLYYRLNVININLPNLRDRIEDIPILANKLLEKQEKKLGKQVGGFTEGALLKLKEYNYPGNVRELENIIMSAVALADKGKALTKEDIVIHQLKGEEKEDQVTGYDPFEESLDEFMYKVEKQIIERVMEVQGGNVSRASETLGIKRQTLQHKLKKYDI